MAPPRAVTCLISAAALWCPEVSEPPRPQLSWRGSGDDRGVERHQFRLRPEEVTTHRGVRVTTPVQTLQHVARLCRFEDAVAAGDQLLRLGVDDTTVAGILAGAKLRGHLRLTRVLSALDRRSTNRFESFTRLLLVEADVGPVISQWYFEGHWYDFWLPAISTLVESDSFEWHSSREHYRRDRRVSQAAAARGLSLVRLSWEDVFVDGPATIGLFHSVAVAHRDRRMDAKGA